MIDQLRRFNEHTTDLLETVALNVFAVTLRTACEAKNLPVPELLLTKFAASQVLNNYCGLRQG